MRKILIIVCLFIIIPTISPYSITAAQEETKNRSGIPLVIGLIPEQNIFDQIKRYTPLAEYISRKIGMEVKLKVLTRYGNIVDNFESLKLDGAFFGSFVYALAHAKLGVEVLARPESADGVSTYHGLMIVRKDSNIKKAYDMHGKRFAFVDKATTAGYLFPLAYLKQHGIKDYQYFKETYFAGTHEDVIYDVLNKRADVGAVKNTVFKRFADLDNRISDELVILERSSNVPSNGLAVKKDLSSALKISLKQTLLVMHNDSEGRRVLAEFGSKKFIETTDDDYSGIYDMTKEADINLGSYVYVND